MFLGGFFGSSGKSDHEFQKLLEERIESSTIQAQMLRSWRSLKNDDAVPSVSKIKRMSGRELIELDRRLGFNPYSDTGSFFSRLDK